MNIISVRVEQGYVKYVHVKNTYPTPSDRLAGLCVSFHLQAILEKDLNFSPFPF